MGSLNYFPVLLFHANFEPYQCSLFFRSREPASQFNLNVNYLCFSCSQTALLNHSLTGASCSQRHRWESQTCLSPGPEELFSSEGLSIILFHQKSLDGK